MYKKIFLIMFTLLICITLSSCKEEDGDSSIINEISRSTPGILPHGIYSKFVYEANGNQLVDNEIKVQFGRLSEYNPYSYEHVPGYYFVTYPVIQNIQITLLADSLDANSTNIIQQYQIPFSEFASKKYEIELDEEGYIIGDIPTFTFNLNDLLVDREINRGIFLIISYDSYIGKQISYQLNIFGNTTLFSYFKISDIVESHFECNHIDINDFAKNFTKVEW